MTEEIINEYGYIDDELKEKLKRLEQENKYLQRIDELEQENRVLQAYKDINEDFKQAWDELNEKYKQLRSALEEIREDLVKLKTNDEDDFTYEYSKIEDKVNEVLNEKEL